MYSECEFSCNKKFFVENPPIIKLDLTNYYFFLILYFMFYLAGDRVVKGYFY